MFLLAFWGHSFKPILSKRKGHLQKIFIMHWRDHYKYPWNWHGFNNLKSLPSTSKTNIIYQGWECCCLRNVHLQHELIRNELRIIKKDPQLKCLCKVKLYTRSRGCTTHKIQGASTKSEEVHLIFILQKVVTMSVSPWLGSHLTVFWDWLVY